ncbi:MAG: PASTA domain-containing protein [Pyrinomonadaceae bacterium]
MGILQKSMSIVGKLIIIACLLVAFAGGLLGVIYFQLRGEEVSIPKIVGKNFNEGRDELAGQGLRIKRIASRYSNEPPDTILEQRPRAGTTAKSGLMISVVVSEKNPDGSEAPASVVDDDKAIEEIEEQPELKIEKKTTKPKDTKKKTGPKTRDVITDKTPDKKTEDGGDKGATEPAGDKNEGTAKPSTKPAENKAPAATPKPADKNEPRKTVVVTDSRPRQTPKPNN